MKRKIDKDSEWFIVDMCAAMRRILTRGIGPAIIADQAEADCLNLYYLECREPLIGPRPDFEIGDTYLFYDEFAPPPVPIMREARA